MSHLTKELLVSEIWLFRNAVYKLNHCFLGVAVALSEGKMVRVAVV